MTTDDILKGPQYQLMLYMIESSILTYDKMATEQGIPINDSQVRSILTKVRKTAEGGSPVIPNATPREKILAELHRALVGRYPEFQEESADGTSRPVSVPIWTLCLRTVEESVQRRFTGSGSRAYLEFIAGFLPKQRPLPAASLSSTTTATFSEP